MMNGLELIQQYEQKKAGFNRKMRDLRVELNEVEIELDDQRLATIERLKEHVEAQQSTVKAKRAAFWQALNEAVMTEEFTRKWQMRAIAALASVIPQSQSAIEVVKTGDGAACVAYCLTGVLGRKTVDTLLPGKFVNGLTQSATPDELLRYRRDELSQMCKTLGVCGTELSELAQAEAVLNTLKDFQ